MGRAPCCDKVGLKKGPWTPEEDQILINFIHLHGHSNWRALPKQAGLLRCGKSCRLRWINYLKPDIKRGNFSREEEDAIIQLHEMMGNRWSAIAARLPGRTDNEIKNVWHTHLKKRLNQTQPKKPRKTRDNNVNNITTTTTTTAESNWSSPQQSYTTSEDFSNYEVSSLDLSTNNTPAPTQSSDYSTDYNPIIDESFWESSSFDFDYNSISDILDFDNQSELQQVKEETPETVNNNGGPGLQYYGDENMDFWLDVFVQASGESELPEF